MLALSCFGRASRPSKANTSNINERLQVNESCDDTRQPSTSDPSSTIDASGNLLQILVKDSVHQKYLSEKTDRNAEIPYGTLSSSQTCVSWGDVAASRLAASSWQCVLTSDGQQALWSSSQHVQDTPGPNLQDLLKPSPVHCAQQVLATVQECGVWCGRLEVEPHTAAASAAHHTHSSTLSRMAALAPTMPADSHTRILSALAMGLGASSVGCINDTGTDDPLAPVGLHPVSQLLSHALASQDPPTAPHHLPHSPPHHLHTHPQPPHPQPSLLTPAAPLGSPPAAKRHHHWPPPTITNTDNSTPTNNTPTNSSSPHAQPCPAHHTAPLKVGRIFIPSPAPAPTPGSGPCGTSKHTRMHALLRSSTSAAQVPTCPGLLHSGPPSSQAMCGVGRSDVHRPRGTPGNKQARTPHTCPAAPILPPLTLTECDRPLHHHNQGFGLSLAPLRRLSSGLSVPALQRLRHPADLMSRASSGMGAAGIGGSTSMAGRLSRALSCHLSQVAAATGTGLSATYVAIDGAGGGDAAGVEAVGAEEGDGGAAQGCPLAPQAYVLEAVVEAMCHPVTGEGALLVTMRDVSALAAMEQAMAAVAEAQLAMMCQMFPLHILQALAGLPGALSTPTTAAEARSRSTPPAAARSMRPSGGSHPDIGAQPDRCADMQGASPGSGQCGEDESDGDGALGALAQGHEDVTLLFADVAGYTSMSKQLPARRVMAFMNRLFGKFDRLVEVHGVHKVETAGDCYIVSAGVVETDPETGFMKTLASHDPVDSARRVFAFARDMMAAARLVPMPHTGQPTTIRIGLHTGPCTSGLIGSRLPKFSLFGDSMNTASRMESTAPVGRIQVSETTHALLPDKDWEPTGGMEVKGKGTMLTWLWTDAKPVSAPVTPAAPPAPPAADLTSTYIAPTHEGRTAALPFITQTFRGAGGVPGGPAGLAFPMLNASEPSQTNLDEEEINDFMATLSSTVHSGIPSVPVPSWVALPPLTTTLTQSPFQQASHSHLHLSTPDPTLPQPRVRPQPVPPSPPPPPPRPASHHPPALNTLTTLFQAAAELRSSERLQALSRAHSQHHCLALASTNSNTSIPSGCPSFLGSGPGGAPCGGDGLATSSSPSVPLSRMAPKKCPGGLCMPGSHNTGRVSPKMTLADLMEYATGADSWSAVGPGPAAPAPTTAAMTKQAPRHAMRWSQVLVGGEPGAGTTILGGGQGNCAAQPINMQGGAGAMDGVRGMHAWDAPHAVPSTPAANSKIGVTGQRPSGTSAAAVGTHTPDIPTLLVPACMHAPDCMEQEVAAPGGEGAPHTPISPEGVAQMDIASGDKCTGADTVWVDIDAWFTAARSSSRCSSKDAHGEAVCRASADRFKSPLHPQTSWGSSHCGMRRTYSASDAAHVGMMLPWPEGDLLVPCTVPAVDAAVAALAGAMESRGPDMDPTGLMCDPVDLSLTASVTGLVELAPLAMAVG